MTSDLPEKQNLFFCSFHSELKKMRKFGEIPYREENTKKNVYAVRYHVFFPVFAALGVQELYLIASLNFILVAFGATCNNILFSANK